MKKQILALALGILLGSSIFLGATAVAGENIKLIVNGVAVQCDVPPQIINGRVMVPVRFVAEAMGAEVEWNAATQTVIINSGQISSGSSAVEQRYPENTSGGNGAVGTDLNSLIMIDVFDQEDFRFDEWKNGDSFIIDGQTYSKGIANAQSTGYSKRYITYDLGGQFTTLTGMFGIDDGDDSNMKLGEFLIVVRDSTGNIKKYNYLAQGGKGAVPISVDVSGAQSISIHFDCHKCHLPVFANPKLY